MVKTFAGLAALAVFGAFVSSAAAEERLLTGKKLDMRDRGAKGRLTLTVRDPSASGPVAQSGGDPRVAGAAVSIENPTTGESATMILPASGWSANAKQTKFKFRNNQAPAGSSPVKVARIVAGKGLRVRALASGITLDESQQGSILVSLDSGDLRYCSGFGGDVRKDEPGRFKSRNAATAQSCPGTATPTTTTTTLPPSALCGNGTVDAGEQCDVAGTTCGGLPCNVDCTCPCDFLDPSLCMYPFPSDFLTVNDPSTPTGRRVNFSLTGMPRNTSEKPIDPADWNRNDGFSPGAMLITKIPGFDFAQTAPPPITDIERSLDANSPVVIVNADTLEHHLFWAEEDANAASDDDRVLIMRPSVNFAEGTRYVVALRNMKDAAGDVISPNADFLAYRDNTPTGDPVKEARRPAMEDVFTVLGDAGVPRGDLYLAWDFTVASVESSTQRLLFMRDDAFATLGAASPQYAITQIENDVNTKIFRRITGVHLVDRYMDSPATGGRMLIGPDGLPLKQPTPQQSNFVCVIPRAALASATATAVPARGSIYGHGLFGSASNVNDANVHDMANEHNFVFCATDWLGMSTVDIPTAVAITGDLSQFSAIPDRLQQAALNFLFLARLLIHPDGFVADPAFQDLLGNPVIDTSNVFYDGNSQGGIAGGMVMSVAQDVTRGVLGVPAMNYSTLLRRSVDFDLFAIPLYQAYTDQLEHNVLFGLIQMLWDRGEPNGYAHHMTDDPLPNTPPHQVLMQIALGDHQVANIASEVQARTIGAAVYQPALLPGRHTAVDPYFQIDSIAAFPHPGSAYVIWDSNQPVPPDTNTPPRGGSDPHSHPRNTVSARVQKSEFLRPTGGVIDVCNASPCLSDQYIP